MLNYCFDNTWTMLQLWHESNLQPPSPSGILTGKKYAEYKSGQTISPKRETRWFGNSINKTYMFITAVYTVAPSCWKYVFWCWLRMVIKNIPSISV